MVPHRTDLKHMLLEAKKSNFCIFLLDNLDNSRFFCIFAAVLCVCALMHVHEERILRTRAEWELSIAFLSNTETRRKRDEDDTETDRTIVERTTEENYT